MMESTCGKCWNCCQCGEGPESREAKTSERLKGLPIDPPVPINSHRDEVMDLVPSDFLSQIVDQVRQQVRQQLMEQETSTRKPDVRSNQECDLKGVKPKLRVVYPSPLSETTSSKDHVLKPDGSLQKPSHCSDTQMMDTISTATLDVGEPSYISHAMLETYWDRKREEKPLKTYWKSQESLEAWGDKTPGNLLDRGKKKAGRVLAVLAMFGGISAGAISSLYRHLPNDFGDKPWTSKHEARQSLPWEVQTPVQSLRPKTTLALLIGAIGAYGSSTGYIYYRQRHKPRHDIFLMCGVWVGLLAGYMCGFNIQETIFRLLPAFALISILAVNVFRPDKRHVVMTPEYVA